MPHRHFRNVFTFAPMFICSSIALSLAQTGGMISMRPFSSHIVPSIGSFISFVFLSVLQFTFVIVWPGIRVFFHKIVEVECFLALIKHYVFT